MPNIIEITDFNVPELDVYARLNENQLTHYYEPNGGLFIAESPIVVERALDAGYEPVSLLLEKKHIETQARDIIARCGAIPVYTADFDVLAQLTGFQLTRGVLCAMRRPPLPTVEEICANARRIVILENVMNPTNVGAIFRSAAALNMDAVLLTPACSNPLYRRAIRVSMGTVFQIPWTYLSTDAGPSLPKCTYATEPLATREANTANSAQNFGDASFAADLEPIKKSGFKTVAMALTDNSVPIDHPDLMAEEKLAIIMGTEGMGLADSTIANSDYTVKIPMSHGVDSLNVAAASAVAFWQLGKSNQPS